MIIHVLKHKKRIKSIKSEHVLKIIVYRNKNMSAPTRTQPSRNNKRKPEPLSKSGRVEKKKKDPVNKNVIISTRT